MSPPERSTEFAESIKLVMPSPDRSGGAEASMLPILTEPPEVRPMRPPPPPMAWAKIVGE